MKRPVGRPYKILDKRQIKKLAEIGCTLEEMAYILECDRDTLSDNYSAIIKSADCGGRQSLRHKQYQIALDGNPTMLIWLGKHRLGQRDLEEETRYKPEAKKLFESLSNSYKAKKAMPPQEKDSEKSCDK